MLRKWTSGFADSWAVCAGRAAPERMSIGEKKNILICDWPSCMLMRILDRERLAIIYQLLSRMAIINWIGIFVHAGMSEQIIFRRHRHKLVDFMRTHVFYFNCTSRIHANAQRRLPIFIFRFNWNRIEFMQFESKQWIESIKKENMGYWCNKVRHQMQIELRAKNLQR